MSRTFMNEPFTLRLTFRSLWALFIRPSFSPYAPQAPRARSGPFGPGPGVGCAAMDEGRV